MKNIGIIVAALLMVPFLCIGDDIKEKPDRTAPYFVVTTKDGVDGFPLLKTEAKTYIAGVVANVELTQVYKNSGDKTIEAIYVFPMGTGAAIHAMKMEIDDRIIEADIHETEKARKIYEDAKNQGKVTSLLEQKRPNVFKMNVANIMPGDVVNVTVRYTELLVPEEGVYEYVFPTVVGPRFTGEDSTEKLQKEGSWTASPYQKEGEKPSYAFNIEVKMNAGIPISLLEVPTHKTNITKDGGKATVQLAPEDRKRGNKDFILRYSLQGNKIHSGLVMYPGEKENFFLLMMEPPKNINIDMIPPREYVFVVDVSGSMHGFPLDTSKELINGLLSGLREEDYFNIMFFAGGANVLSEEPLPVTKDNIKKAMKMLKEQRGGGGTRILNAMERVSKLKKKEGMSRIIITATDGYVSVEKRTFDKIREDMNEANFFAFGIGSSVNRHLIEGMARVGNGKPFVITNAKEAKKTAEKFMAYIQYPLLTDIAVEFDGFDAYDIEPPHLPDLFSERPLILFGKYKNAKGNIVVKGKIPGGDFEKTFKVTPALENKNNTALKYLWARKKLELLSDYAQVGVLNKKEITEIGLKYHLMTEYTSFVAVDKVVRDTGEVVTVKQPLPLPEGVSNHAVGDRRYRYAASGIMKGRNLAFKLGGLAGKPKPAVECADIAVDCQLAEPENSTKEEGKQDKKIKDISIIGGTYPQGITLKEAEKLIKAAVEKDLVKAFNEWGLKKVTLSIEIDAGAVKRVKIVRYQGKKCIEKELEIILKKVKFAREFIGRLTIILM